MDERQIPPPKKQNFPKITAVRNRKLKQSIWGHNIIPATAHHRTGAQQTSKGQINGEMDKLMKDRETPYLKM